MKEAAPYACDEQGFSSLYRLCRRARAVDLSTFLAGITEPALVPDESSMEIGDVDGESGADSGVRLLTISIGGAGALRYLNKVAFVRKRPGNPYAHLISVGRSATNDLVVALDTVSKVHGYFVRQDDQWQFTDRGSTNGSHLNGRPISANEPAPLRDGDRLRLGHEITFVFMEPPSLYQHALTAMV